MKSVLIVHHCDGWGGAGVSLLYCCKILLKKYGVTVCLPHQDSEVANELRKVEGIDIISLEEDMAMISAYNGGPKWYSRTFWTHLFKIKRTESLISQILEKNRYDLVIENSLTLSWISKLTRRMRVKSICYIRETKINNIGFFISRHYLNRYCDGVLFISDYDKSDMRLKTKMQMTVPDIVEFKSSYSNVYNIPKNSFVVVYLGGDDPLKGYSTVRDLMNKRELQSLTFVIAGSVAEENKITRDNVIYVGRISDVGEILSVADLLIFPSLEGHQARPVFEAGAFHIPVVVSNFPQTKENVIDGWNGYEFEPGDVDDLLEKILKVKNMVDSPDLGEKNYALFQEKHSYKACEDKLFEFMSMLI